MFLDSILLHMCNAQFGLPCVHRSRYVGCVGRTPLLASSNNSYSMIPDYTDAKPPLAAAEEQRRLLNVADTEMVDDWLIALL